MFVVMPVVAALLPMGTIRRRRCIATRRRRYTIIWLSHILANYSPRSAAETRTDDGASTASGRTSHRSTPYATNRTAKHCASAALTAPSGDCSARSTTQRATNQFTFATA